jgi:hypothetical protein
LRPRVWPLTFDPPSIRLKAAMSVPRLLCLVWIDRNFVKTFGATSVPLVVEPVDALAALPRERVPVTDRVEDFLRGVVAI